MSTHYTRYHPKWHRERMPIFWWLRKLSYVKFISRELTSLAVAYTAIVLLLQVWTLDQGEETYRRFSAWLASPAVLVLHALVAVTLLFHTVTWLRLAPSALVVRLRGRRLPDTAILITHYLAWAVASGFTAWYLLGS